MVKSGISNLADIISEVTFKTYTSNRKTQLKTSENKLIHMKESSILDYM